MKASFNQADLSRIKGKLAKVQTVGKSGLVYKYRLDLLTGYAEAIQSVMGEMYADGGSMSSDIIPKIEKTFMVNWVPLTERTQNIKRKNNWDLYIWEASGETKKAVKVSSDGTFAGISKATDEEAYNHAVATEYGGVSNPDETPQYSKRALFTVANDVVMQNKGVIFKAITELLIKDIGWGQK